MTYISSQSIAIPMRTSVLQAQAALAQAQSEIASGVHADLGLSLGARTGTSLSLKNEIDRLGSFKTANASTSTRLAATTTALGTMLSSAQDMSKALLTASTTGGLTTAATASAKNALQSLLATMNTSAGGQYVFGGIATDTAPAKGYTDTSSAKAAVDAAFQNAFGMSQTDPSASSISATDMQAFLDGPFAALFDDSGWQANWSGASDQTIQSDIAPGQTVTTSVSANDAALRRAARAYTMVSEFTGTNLSDAARQTVVTSASKLIGSAVDGLINLNSGVGVTQAALASANDGIGAQVDLLKTHVDDLDGVDPYALSAKVTQLQTQLEASYQLTSRLSQLSLVNYLR